MYERQPNTLLARQRYNKAAAVTNCAMLMLATIMLVFPDVMEQSHDISECRMLGMVSASHLSLSLPLHTLSLPLHSPPLLGKASRGKRQAPGRRDARPRPLRMLHVLRRGTYL